MHRALLALPLLTLAGGCAELGGNVAGEPALRAAEILVLAEDRFSVTIVAENMDGYVVARCLAAGFLEGKAEVDGVAYPVYLRDGGKITDEFRVQDGVRTHTSAGIQTYTILPEGDPTDADGKDLMSTANQIALCTRRGLPLSPEDLS